MILQLGDTEIIKLDKTETAHKEAIELIEKAVKIMQGLEGFTPDVIGRNVCHAYANEADSILDEFKFRDGVIAEMDSICMIDMVAAEEIT